MGVLDGLTDREWELVHTSYAQAMQSLEQNEEMGERRLQLLFTVASAAAVAVGLVADSGDDHLVALRAAAGLSLAVGLLGLLTVRRLVVRNLATTYLQTRLADIRRQVSAGKNQLPSLFVYDPSEPDPEREQAWRPSKGGLIDIAGCATATFLGASFMFAGFAFEWPAGWVVLPGIVITIVSWFLQAAWVRRLYREEEDL